MEQKCIKIKDYEENAMDISEIGEYFVLSFSKDIHVKVSALSKKIIEKFNGTKTLEAITDELNSEGIDITKKDIERFVDRELLTKGLLENVDFKQEKSRLWFHVPLIKGEKLDFILNPLSILYKKAVAIPIIIAIMLIQIFAVIFMNYTDFSNMRLVDDKTLVAGLIVIFSVIVHEFGHAAAARYYNVRSGNMGIGLYLYWPVLYTDLSCAWKLDRKKRIVTDLGGIYFQFIFMFFILAALLITRNDIYKLTNILLVVCIWRNINPALRTDGYWILTDLFGIVNLNNRAFKIFGQIIRGIFRMKWDIDFSFNLKKGLQPLFYIYLTIYLLTTFMMFGFAVVFIINAIINVNLYIVIFSSLFQLIANGNLKGALSHVNESSGILLLTFIMAFSVISMIKGIIMTKAGNH